MAIEDAAVLGRLFVRLSHPSQITPLLHAYTSLRLPRTSTTQASSRANQHIFHLPDGEEQRERDASMRSAMLGLLSGDSGEYAGNANQWADKKKNAEQFSYDADEAAEKWWREGGDALLAVTPSVGRTRNTRETFTMTAKL